MSKPLSRVEFVALIAMLHATVAFSIDSMLPALSTIGEAISPDAPNRIQLVISSFVLGMGFGTLFVGPLSDAYGRRPVLISGSLVYFICAIIAAQADSLEWMLVARFFQGVGASGPRIVATAMVRDVYTGRGMARIMSFVMMVFTLIPAIAPLAGAAIVSIGGWRAIFASFAVFATIATLWMGLRQEETLAPEHRRPIRLGLLWEAITEIIRHPVVSLAILAQSFCYLLLFNTINLIQPVFDRLFDMADTFPYWFAGMALISGAAAFINSKLVMRFGMLRLARLAFFVQTGLSLLISLIWIGGLTGDSLFPFYIVWQTSVFFQTAMTLGNLNALAMEPMGHMSGIAGSVIGCIATITGAIMAIPFGQAFDGTLLPLSLGALLASFGAFLTLSLLKQRSHEAA